MNFLAIDDEPLCLDDLRFALEDAAPGCTWAYFSSPSRALEQARTEPFDAAFLDIEMGGANGLALAKQLKDLQPDLHIIFVTGYEKYAVSAFAIHASGYLLKPVDSGDLKRELTFLYGDTPASRPIQVHTFGGFEVCVNGKPLVFNRAKSKELLACLIDRRGAGLTTREACSLLWEDGVYNIARKNYFQTIVHDLRNTLSQAGIASILVKHRNSISIRADMIDCDSYRFLDGDPRAINSYRHNYLPSYSWAEFSVGKMERL